MMSVDGGKYFMKFNLTKNKKSILELNILPDKQVIFFKNLIIILSFKNEEIYFPMNIHNLYIFTPYYIRGKMTEREKYIAIHVIFIRKILFYK